MIFMSMVFLSSGIGASVVVYGSTVSLSALKDSDLNIDLTDACPAKLLKNLYQTLKDDRSGNQFCFALLVLHHVTLLQFFSETPNVHSFKDLYCVSSEAIPTPAQSKRSFQVITEFVRKCPR